MAQSALTSESSHPMDTERRGGGAGAVQRRPRPSATAILGRSPWSPWALGLPGVVPVLPENLQRRVAWSAAAPALAGPSGSKIGGLLPFKMPLIPHPRRGKSCDPGFPCAGTRMRSSEGGGPRFCISDILVRNREEMYKARQASVYGSFPLVIL
uniref:Uncharacterized protein n=1 Tax=Myotis myotis TaxID=51298 RepID=A0A7J7Z465_MYOMY|nr:hypothetical protein mMyoMyo1_010418 [Myotis myotis]